MSSIVLYQTTATGAGTTNSFDVQAPSTLITDPFVKTDPITGTYFLGVTALGSQDEAPPLHLVLALNNAFAAGLVSGGQDFADIFAGYDEASLIGALTTLSDGSSTQTAIDDASNLIFNFSETVTADQGLFGSTDTFSMVSFSTASTFGDGISFTTDAGVPEPAAWALMILGFGGAGALLRRRRGTAATA
ncbi:MAG: PEP-CTERM sorting domain-containing protein [Proteobacteria bacterium]|nr:PEP-CTERM sorting domain-containing protein [Pseudomonadota bacterium]